jgi:hypothetical protein
MRRSTISSACSSPRGGARREGGRCWASTERRGRWERKTPARRDNDVEHADAIIPSIEGWRAGGMTPSLRLVCGSRGCTGARCFLFIDLTVRLPYF